LIIGDPDVEIGERAEVLYMSARDVMKDLMDDPRSGRLFDTASRLASDAVWFLFNQPASFSSLLKVTSYDYYTYTHCVNVFTFCMALTRKMGYSEKEVLGFGTGALLHDVGKCMIPEEIVRAPGKLTPEQWDLMKQHPALGAQILSEQGIDDPVIHDITLHHHEKVNGKGYPGGLMGKDLSLFSRICTIVDIFDALTTQRTYKDAMGSFPALKLMQDAMVEELDPHLFRNFIELMGSHGPVVQKPSRAD
jgi:putative nucleotidyltransferase with HDIG domain